MRNFSDNIFIQFVLKKLSSINYFRKICIKFYMYQESCAQKLYYKLLQKSYM